MNDAEIIRAVAEKVMGCKQFRTTPFAGCFVRNDDDENWQPFNPIIDANHTLMIIEKMRELGWYFSVHNELPQWDARFWTRGTFPGEAAFEYNLGTAVCLAALKAVEK